MLESASSLFGLARRVVHSGNIIYTVTPRTVKNGEQGFDYDLQMNPSVAGSVGFAA